MSREMHSDWRIFTKLSVTTSHEFLSRDCCHGFVSNKKILLSKHIACCSAVSVFGQPEITTITPGKKVTVALLIAMSKFRCKCLNLTVHVKEKATREADGKAFVAETCTAAFFDQGLYEVELAIGGITKVNISL